MISGKSYKYPVGFKDRAFIDKTYDEFDDIFYNKGNYINIFKD